MPFKYQFQSQTKSFVSAEQTKVEAEAPISDSNSRFLMVQCGGGREDVAAVASSFVQRQPGTRILEL